MTAVTRIGGQSTDFGSGMSTAGESPRTVQVDLPCKWMLAGEYAVLSPRGLALAVAVRPGFGLRLEPGAGSTFRPEGFEVLPRTAGPAGAAWPDFFLRAWSRAAARLPRGERGKGPPGQISTFFPASGGSFGPRPGSSAALAVGTICALDAWWGLGLPAELRLALARSAHAEAQGGGSGYDVNTIGLGGVVLTRASARSRPESRPALPGIWLVCARAKEKTPTTRHLAAFAKALSRPPFRKALSRHVRASNALVRFLWSAAGRTQLPDRRQRQDHVAPRPDFDLLARRVAAAEKTLRELSALGRLGVFTPEVDAMLALARRLEQPARVSGGGGGDAVVAFAPDRDAAERLSAAFGAEGWPAALLPPDSPCEGPKTLLVC
ncbi:MAG: hypothetical protein FJ109_05255 [Deltaproteobacteria bacterium]|nr:hypothetical protein [Deltaproteobacteria bacterium]